jgi:hypothetical protein
MAVSMRWKLLAAAAAATALAFGACGGDDKKEPEDGGGGNGNRSDAGGFPGLDFLDGGLESLLADLDDDVAGSPCSADSDCKGKNATCLTDLSGAGNKGSCTGVCTDDDQCGAGGTCVKVSSSIEGLPGQCAKTCSGNSGCSPELQCRKGIDLSDVISGINDLFDGGIGVQAENTPSICQAKLNTVTLSSGSVGKACTKDDECGGGTCGTGPLYPGGYCGGACLEDSDCGNTGGCTRSAITQALGGPGSCLKKCSTNTDCREGYSCSEDALGVVFGPGKFCVTEINLPDGGFFGDGGLPGADGGQPTADASTGDSGSAGQDAGADTGT